MSFPGVKWCPGSDTQVYHSCAAIPKRTKKYRCPTCNRRLKLKRDIGDGTYEFYECYILRIPRHKGK